MAKRLYAAANLTVQSATLTSSETNKDTATLDSETVVHTGGADGDYCHIPKCSDKKYFNDHHMSIKGGSLNIAFWTNDDQDYELYYSLDGTFGSGHPVPESSYWNGVTCLVDADHVTFFPY